jgi:hypothetical protein
MNKEGGQKMQKNKSLTIFWKRVSGFRKTNAHKKWIKNVVIDDFRKKTLHQTSYF